MAKKTANFFPLYCKVIFFTISTKSTLSIDQKVNKGTKSDMFSFIQTNLKKIFTCSINGNKLNPYNRKKNIHCIIITHIFYLHSLQYNV